MSDASRDAYEEEQHPRGEQLPELPGDWTWDALYAETERLVANARIDHSYTVIELSNRSWDGKIVYIDKHVPSVLTKTGIRPDDTLPWHELSEFIMQNHGLKYLPAHHIATQIEKRRVEEIFERMKKS